MYRRISITRLNKISSAIGKLGVIVLLGREDWRQITRTIPVTINDQMTALVVGVGLKTR